MTDWDGRPTAVGRVVGLYPIEKIEATDAGTVIYLSDTYDRDVRKGFLLAGNRDGLLKPTDLKGYVRSTGDPNWLEFMIDSDQMNSRWRPHD